MSKALASEWSVEEPATQARSLVPLEHIFFFVPFLFAPLLFLVEDMTLAGISFSLFAFLAYLKVTTAGIHVVFPIVTYFFSENVKDKRQTSIRVVGIAIAIFVVVFVTLNATIQYVELSPWVYVPAFLWYWVLLKFHIAKQYFGVFRSLAARDSLVRGSKESSIVRIFENYFTLIAIFVLLPVIFVVKGFGVFTSAPQEMKDLLLEYYVAEVALGIVLIGFLSYLVLLVRTKASAVRGFVASVVGLHPILAYASPLSSLALYTLNHNFTEIGMCVRVLQRKVKRKKTVMAIMMGFTVGLIVAFVGTHSQFRAFLSSDGFHSILDFPGSALLISLFMAIYFALFYMHGDLGRIVHSHKF